MTPLHPSATRLMAGLYGLDESRNSGEAVLALDRKKAVKEEETSSVNTHLLFIFISYVVKKAGVD
jgi:hypothetical protein